MTAGASARREAERSRLRAEQYERRLQEERANVRRYRVASESERRVAERLAALDVYGWRLLPDRRWPGTRNANVDLISVGPGGVLVIDVKAWADPSVDDAGHLYRGQADADEEVEKVDRAAALVDEAVAEVGLAPLHVLPVLVFSRRQGVSHRIGRVELVGERDLEAFCVRRGQRLSPRQVERVTEVLAAAFPPYEAPPPAATAVDPEPVLPRQAEPPAALFDVEALATAEIEAALQAPVEDWMVFLHPSQQRLVRRTWSGPARVRGPAGTGKTVVGLHRAAHLAATGPGPILYTSFVRTLPQVLGALYQRLSPSTVDRVEFVGLHQWALRLLSDRGARVTVDSRRVDRAFQQAWGEVGRASVLAGLCAGPRYWQDEVDHVIKGRGLVDFDDYAGLARVGRRTALQVEHRAAVWDLYQRYDELLRGQGVHDFNDILLMALDCVRAEPVTPAYRAVIVDEVQDLPCIGVRLLHALVGDVPDGLLLIGDGQQAVYPGGFTLAEAGIAVAGRATVLRDNHRNGAEILRVAREVVADQTFDDLEGVVEAGTRDVSCTRPGGQALTVVADDLPSHDTALLKYLRAAAQQQHVGWGGIALLSASNTKADRYVRLLSEAGIPAVTLLQYDGRPVDAVKVGTFKRAKGLEFKFVFLPWLSSGTPRRRPTESEQAWRERVELDRRELFVGMTRARDGLWLGYVSSALTGRSTHR